MRLTFVTDLGQTYSIEIDPNMELADVMALLEAEVNDPLWCTTSAHVLPRSKSGIPSSEQSISHEGRELNNPKATMEGLGVSDNAMLLFRRKTSVGRYFSQIELLIVRSDVTVSQGRRTRCRDDSIAASSRSCIDANGATSTTTTSLHPFRCHALRLRAIDSARARSCGLIRSSAVCRTLQGVEFP
jgi:hypothetical protein